MRNLVITIAVLLYSVHGNECNSSLTSTKGTVFLKDAIMQRYLNDSTKVDDVMAYLKYNEVINNDNDSYVESISKYLKQFDDWSVNFSFMQKLRVWFPNLSIKLIVTIKKMVSESVNGVENIKQFESMISKSEFLFRFREFHHEFVHKLEVEKEIDFAVMKILRKLPEYDNEKTFDEFKKHNTPYTDDQIFLYEVLEKDLKSFVANENVLKKMWKKLDNVLPVYEIDRVIRKILWKIDSKYASDNFERFKSSNFMSNLSAEWFDGAPMKEIEEIINKKVSEINYERCLEQVTENIQEILLVTTDSITQWEKLKKYFIDNKSFLNETCLGNAMENATFLEEKVKSHIREKNLL